jgi:DNA mismatch endonuclease (patch repair protein)
MDRIAPEVRSRMMAAIRGRDTKPELLVRRLLHAMGYRFRLHRRDLPGCPDIVLPRHRAVVFVHGCFWHRHRNGRCRLATTPKSRVGFWASKFRANRERDARSRRALARLGWKVLVLWECEMEEPQRLEARLARFLACARRSPGGRQGARAVQRPAPMPDRIGVRFERSGLRAGRAALSRATAELLGDALRALRPHGLVDVLYCSRARIRRLKREHFGIDAETDVLSFPASDPVGDAGRSAPAHLGDIALCLPFAADQAARRRRTLAKETALLLVHGLLHLVGEDHDTPARKARMWAAQKRLLAGSAAEAFARLDIRAE